MIQKQRRLLSQAQAIGKDLTTGDVVPHLWQNLESEWNEFNKDLRITSGIGKIRKGRVLIIPDSCRLSFILHIKVQSDFQFILYRMVRELAHYHLC